MKKSWSIGAFAALCCVLVVALLALPVASLATSADDEDETGAETDEAADDENSGEDADSAEESDASADDESADTSEETEASADDAVAAATSDDESDSGATDDVDGATDEGSDDEDDEGTAYGAVFEDVRMGLRVQVQYVKDYASTEDLVNECVDPRFDLVTKGIAPTFEELNGSWAVPGDGYGELIAATIDDLLEFVLC